MSNISLMLADEKALNECPMTSNKVKSTQLKTWYIQCIKEAWDARWSTAQNYRKYHWVLNP